MAATATGLCEFIDASPSPFHACVTVAQRLRAAGYTELAETDRWPGASGRYFTVRAGSLVAWDGAGATSPGAGFRIVGAHTDSPNLRVKQHPVREVAGWQLVALAPYGGAWLNSWLDRDLGVSGRLSVRSGAHYLVRIDEPILRVPQLAIHLADDRKAVTLDPQRHLNAVWGDGAAPDFLGYVAERAGVEPREVLGFDLMTHDLAPSAITGAGREFVSAPRLDNQASCYAGLEALLSARSAGQPGRYLP
ncbi:MAG TPA: M18 family aminopeptidase, partial [Mycobacterium sp.]|nr:M18 family aminopeptidase [Mycobacterium sp.]